jgi:hypothetical protein
MINRVIAMAKTASEKKIKRSGEKRVSGVFCPFGSDTGMAGCFISQ